MTSSQRSTAGAWRSHSRPHHHHRSSCVECCVRSVSGRLSLYQSCHADSTALLYHCSSASTLPCTVGLDSTSPLHAHTPQWSHFLTYTHHRSAIGSRSQPRPRLRSRRRRPVATSCSPEATGATQLGSPVRSPQSTRTVAPAAFAPPACTQSSVQLLGLLETPSQLGPLSLAM